LAVGWVVVGSAGGGSAEEDWEAVGSTRC
jgi:hypothetical protein